MIAGNLMYPWVYTLKQLSPSLIRGRKYIQDGIYPKSVNPKNVYT